MSKWVPMKYNQNKEMLTRFAGWCNVNMTRSQINHAFLFQRVLKILMAWYWNSICFIESNDDIFPNIYSRFFPIIQIYISSSSFSRSTRPLLSFWRLRHWPEGRELFQSFFRLKIDMISLWKRALLNHCFNVLGFQAFKRII